LTLHLLSPFFFSSSPSSPPLTKHSLILLQWLPSNKSYPFNTTNKTQINSITISSTKQHSFSSSSLFSPSFPHKLLTSSTNHSSPETGNSSTFSSSASPSLTASSVAETMKRRKRITTQSSTPLKLLSPSSFRSLPSSRTSPKTRLSPMKPKSKLGATNTAGTNLWLWSLHR